jgi:hypothetical protein
MVIGAPGMRGDTANAVGYCFTLSIESLQNMQLLVGVQPSLKWSYEVGGAYELTFLDAQVWHQLLDKRGPKLPIAVWRLDGFSVQVRIDGVLREHLPTVKILTGH